MLYRHPFPGPGLAVRMPGEITRERVRILQEADAIFIEELRASGDYDRTAQAFTVLLPVRSVGVMGDERTYENVAALRAVTTVDYMTADWARLPHDLLDRVSQADRGGGPRSEPGRLRRHVEASSDHRVGVTGSAPGSSTVRGRWAERADSRIRRNSGI